MTYAINYNAKFNSYEVTFDGKPSEEVRAALKALKFRWHSVKRCWYGYGSEEQIAHAITDASTEEAPNTVIGDGYLGGGSIYGSKSNRHLYGADLSAAIRADVKAAGLKGVTIKCKTYAGGQSITATVKVQPSDYISHKQWLEDYRISGSQYWIYYGPGAGEYMHVDKFYGLDGEAREQIRIAAAEFEWQKLTTQEQSVRISWVNWLTDSAKAKLEKLDALISAYRYDESNGMVDYFNTNFYYDICLKPTAA